jgi:uncharacterized protein YuzE
MSNVTSFNVTYDADSDVLYISKRKAPAASGVQDKYGFVWRYDADGDLIGLTVLDFKDFWCAKRDILENEISEHFSISRAQANVVLSHAAHG